jgi:uncharacterized protein (TIGR02284 family)
LNECERGEGFLLMRYDDVLKKDDLDPATRELMTRQRATVQGNVDRVKGLRRTLEHVEK